MTMKKRKGKNRRKKKGRKAGEKGKEEIRIGQKRRG